MSTHTITVQVTADESAFPLDLPALREGIARLVHEFYGVDGENLYGYGDSNALVSDIVVDGQTYSATEGTLS